MRQITIDGKTITDDSEAYVIGEIGNNHGGSVEKCKELMVMAKLAGCDAVKLQKRDNKTLMTKTLYNSPYENENSYGKTYGEHREALEFNREQYEELFYYCRSIGITFFATAFDEPSAYFLNDLGMPAFKVASADIVNIPLLRTISQFGKPIIISTGGCSMLNILQAYNSLRFFGHKEFCFLHAIASYPNKDEQLNLRVIDTLNRTYPETVIGFSNHHPAVFPSFVAYTLGARIFEVHITDNRANKGTDHCFSMEPHGVEMLCSDLKRIKKMIGSGNKTVLPEEVKPIQKMGKGVYLTKTMKAGDIVYSYNVTLKCPAGADGLSPVDIGKIDGMVLISEGSTSEPLKWSDLK